MIQPSQQSWMVTAGPQYPITTSVAQGNIHPMRTQRYRTTCDFLVLVIDDSPMCAKVARHVIVHQLQCSVLVAHSGNEGLKIAKERYNDISMVLLDITLPDMNGFDVVNALRSVPTLAHLPVLFASSNNDDIDSLCLSLGAMGFVLKPVQRHIMSTYILAVAPELTGHLILDQSSGDDLNVANYGKHNGSSQNSAASAKMQMRMLVDQRESMLKVKAANAQNAQNNARLGVGLGLGAVVFPRELQNRNKNHNVARWHNSWQCNFSNHTHMDGKFINNDNDNNSNLKITSNASSSISSNNNDNNNANANTNTNNISKNKNNHNISSSSNNKINTISTSNTNSNTIRCNNNNNNVSSDRNTITTTTNNNNNVIHSTTTTMNCSKLNTRSNGRTNQDTDDVNSINPNINTTISRTNTSENTRTSISSTSTSIYNDYYKHHQHHEGVENSYNHISRGLSLQGNCASSLGSGVISSPSSSSVISRLNPTSVSSPFRRKRHGSITSHSGGVRKVRVHCHNSINTSLNNMNHSNTHHGQNNKIVDDGTSVINNTHSDHNDHDCDDQAGTLLGRTPSPTTDLQVDDGDIGNTIGEEVDTDEPHVHRTNLHPHHLHVNQDNQHRHCHIDRHGLVDDSTTPELNSDNPDEEGY